jgi:prepilin-type N-terminal cleavage/methylation domain-containing protein
MQTRVHTITNMRFIATGFTLVELSLVLAIVAVLSAIAIPRYANAQSRYQADSAALRIKNDIELIRKSAMQASQSRELLISTDLNEYHLINVKDLDKGVTKYSVDLGNATYQADLVSAFGTLRDYSGRKFLSVTFDGFGKPNAGGNIVIAIGDQQRTISLDVDTGKVVVR